MQARMHSESEDLEQLRERRSAVWVCVENEESSSSWISRLMCTLCGRGVTAEAAGRVIGRGEDGGTRKRWSVGYGVIAAAWR